MLKRMLLATSVACLAATPAIAQTGNGGPSGPHYNLNIIGVNANQDRPDNAAGHVIFVDLDGKSKINLCNSSDSSAMCYATGFAVIDKDGTDADGAAFALPNPDPDGDGTTTYSVFARALGSPKLIDTDGDGVGDAKPTSKTTTCATDPNGPTEVCSVISMVLVRDKGKSTFTNVSKYLLYIYADITGDGILERVPLFDSRLEDYFWEYDNKGLRLAQLRFYPCSTTVPASTDPTGDQVTTCFD